VRFIELAPHAAQGAGGQRFDFLRRKKTVPARSPEGVRVELPARSRIGVFVRAFDDGAQRR